MLLDQLKKYRKEFQDLNGKCYIGKINIDDIIHELEIKQSFEKKVCDLPTLEKVLNDGLYYIDDKGQLRKALFVSLMCLSGGVYGFLAHGSFLNPQEKNIKWSTTSENIKKV